jgi:hypothetical protein
MTLQCFIDVCREMNLNSEAIAYLDYVLEVREEFEKAAEIETLLDERYYRDSESIYYTRDVIAPIEKGDEIVNTYIVPLGERKFYLIDVGSKRLSKLIRESKYRVFSICVLVPKGGDAIAKVTYGDYELEFLKKYDYKNSTFFIFFKRLEIDVPIPEYIVIDEEKIMLPGRQ